VGELWWAKQTTYPEFMRLPVGILEIICALTLFKRSLVSYTCFILMGIMIGAIISHLPNGYSYKNMGIEVALTYFLLSSWLFVRYLPKRLKFL
jgi:uncharacterized membrane protein YphA (DoxX/SURF4 family)